MTFEPEPDHIRDVRDRIYRSDDIQRDLPPDLGKDGVEVFKPEPSRQAAEEDLPPDPTKEAIEEVADAEEADAEEANAGAGQQWRFSLDADVVRPAFWIVVAGVLGIWGFFFLRNRHWRHDRGSKEDEEILLGDETAGDGLTLPDHTRSSADAMVHDLLLQSITLLKTHGTFKLKAGSTARDILAMAKIGEEERHALAILVSAVESTRFARRPANASLLAACEAAFGRLKTFLPGPAHDH
ncbi:MAG: hypothetical protein ACR2P3_09365 [Geminicoccaceae bacterium]